jgi:CO/xanthine dehydrogenase FAD-binding subunit
MALGDFLLGPRRTALRRDELMTAVRVPRPRAAAASHFLKLGARRYLVISIAMASAVLEHERGQVQAARVSVGACSGVAVRLGALETALQGQRFARSLADHVRAAHFAGLTPIADVRASAAYRREAAQELVRRLLREMA